ncbi:SKIP/SNW domain containing protein, partial [Chondrus crispus]
ADATAERTRVALEKVVNGKIVAAKTHNPHVLARKEKPSFVRYTPANTNTAHNSGAAQRIIKLVEAPVDPMLPPKFSMTKAPVNPPSPPVPVMHSPERKLTKKDAADWKIPPVVSNWKNNRGYTISLDKRLAAEGRDLQDHSINDRFASFAEAMYSAERTARDDVEKRAHIQRQVSIRAKTAKEQELRELADRARRERKGYLGLSEATDTESVAATEPTRAGVAPRAPAPVEAARQLRDDAPPTPSLRREMREERDREFRQHSYIREESTAPTLKRSKLSRDQERDLAERVALGQGTGGGVGGGEVQYDQRLFNQDGAHGRGQSSLAGGFGADDSYSLYDKPLFAGGNASSKFLYRPPRNEGEEEAGAGGRRGKADRPFGGSVAAGATGASKGGAVRDRPVEFERDTELKSAANEDPYGLEQFFTEAKKFEKEAKD